MDTFSHLEFRGEGNRAIVFANPQTKHVYRLVKCNVTRRLRKLLRSGINSDTYKDIKNIQSVVKLELDSVVSYMTNIMRPLLTERYVVTPTITSIPVGFGENAVALAGQARPAHRKNSQFDDVDSDILYALILPDFCYVHHSATCNLKLSTSSSSTEADSSLESPGPTDSEISSAGSQEINRNNSYSSICSQESTSDLHDESMDVNNISRGMDDAEGGQVNSYNSANFVIDTCDFEDMKYGLVDGRPVSCDESVYTSPERFFEQKQHIEDNNRKETQKESTYSTISIEIKPKKAFMTKVNSSPPDIGQVCRFCMHQHLKGQMGTSSLEESTSFGRSLLPLKRKSGIWPQTSSYCPLDLFSGNKHRMKHALLSLVKTPQNNLKICKDGKEVYGSDIRKDLNTILQDWLPVNTSGRQRLVSVFLDLVAEILLSTSDNTSSGCSLLPTLQPQQLGVQKCNSSSFVHYEDAISQELPQGCVLERILGLQTLDELDIEEIFPLYTRLQAKLDQDPNLWNKWCFNGPFEDVTWLFGSKGNQLDDLNPDSDEYAVLKVKRFLVSKTLQDCSIIIAIKPVVKSDIQSKIDLIRFEGGLYEFSVKIIDLDPKPFEKIKTYFRQSSDIANTFAEAAFKTSQTEENSSS